MQDSGNFLIKNRYKAIREIGKGGTGIVYLVQDTLKDNLPFALKTIKHDVLKRFGIKSINTFKNEYEIMTRLKHPNLTQVYEFGTDQDNCYIVQEYLQGRLMSEVQADDDKVIDIMIQILRALEYIHSRNLVYRDIKPANIMMIENNVKLMDFGLCGCIDQTDKKVSGSFTYMAPESLNAVLTFSLDIFSLGICFFELLTKSRFYIDEDFSFQNIILLLKDRNEYRSYKEKRLSLIREEDIRHIISKMINYDIDKRYQNCSDIIYDINDRLNCSYDYETKETGLSYVLGNEFANRKNELKILKNNISAGNRDKLLVYSGSSGIGKTRLFFEFKKYCILNDILFFEAKCMESEIKNYHGIKGILSQLIVLASDDLLSIYGNHLKLIFEKNLRLKDYKPPKIIDDPKLLQEIIVQNITDFIIDFVKEEDKSTIIYFDDYQWIDHGSELIIKNILHRVNNDIKLSLYANINENKMLPERDIMSMFSRSGTRKYDLPPLDDAGISEYIENVFGAEYIDKSIRKAIPDLRRSVGGNPLFMQELIKSFIEKDIIIKDKSFWKMIKTFRIKDIPENIMDIIKSRIEILFKDDDKRRILKVISLFRIDIDIDTIKNIIGKIASIDAAKVLLELEYLEILKVTEIDNIIYYTFANSLIKNYIRDSIENKGEISLFLARTLEELKISHSDEILEETAFLYLEGKDSKKAAYYFEKCGDIARKNYLNYKALSFYDTALKLEEDLYRELSIINKKAFIMEMIGLWDEAFELLQSSIKKAETLDQSLFAELKCSQGIILINQGKYEKAMETLSQARDIGYKIQSNSICLNAIRYMGNIYTNKGDYDRAMKYYKEDKEYCEKHDDKQGYSRAMGNIGNIYWQMGDYDRAIGCFNEQIEICRKLGDKREYAQALGKMGGVYFHKGNYDMAMKYYNEDMQICKELGDKSGYAYTVGNLGVLLKEKGDYNKAEEYYNEKKKICEQLGDKRGYASALGNMGNIYADRGDHDKAMEYYNEYRDICLELGNKKGYSIALGNMGLVYADKGDYEKAMECYNEDMRISNELGDKRGYLCALGNAGEIYFYLGDYDKAMEHFQELETMCREFGYHREYMSAMGNIGGIYFYQGDYEKAMECYKEKRRICEELGEKTGIVDVLIEEGLLYQSMGNYEKALKYYELSLEYCRELDYKSRTARNILLMALTYHDMGNYDEALRYYDRAKDLMKDFIKYDTPFLLYNMARFYFEQSDMKRARELSKEALDLALSINRKDMIFYSKLLIYKMNKNIIEMKALLDDMELTPEQTAFINFELWGLTQDKKYQSDAKAGYEILLKKTPKTDYEKRLKALN